MNVYNYTARKKGYKLPSIQGIAWGENVKRFEKFVDEVCGTVDIICIHSIKECHESDVPKKYKYIAKKPISIL